MVYLAGAGVVGGGGTRRFTDRELALVLKKASEIEESETPDPGRGLSLADLEEIAREVGISPRAISEAVQSLERERALGSPLRGSPLVRRAVRAVPVELDEATISRLIRLVDERTHGAGAVSEALGSVRWTSSERLKNTQVSITPQQGETTIHVIEKSAPRLRRIFHLVPAAAALMLTLPFGEAIEDASGAALALLAVAVAVVGGAAIGRLTWIWMSENSQNRVDRLAAELSAEAEAAVPRSGTGPSGEVS